LRGGHSVAELLAAAVVRLSACGVDSPRLDAEVLLARALGIDRGRLSLLLAGGGGWPPGGPAVGEAEAAVFRALVRRRALREPLAYITGVKEFWSLDLEVTPDVLIPRPETEILVQEALSQLPPSRAAVVVDVGTGSGAVAIAVAAERPAALVAATDISAPALAVARRNIARHGLASRVFPVQCDLLSAVLPETSRGTVAGVEMPRIVLSNPPYVGLEERDTLMPEVRAHEAHGALFAGAGGLEVIERLIPQAAVVLSHGEWLMMEVASTHAAEVASILSATGAWDEVSVRNDYAGLPRVARARRSRR